MSDQEQTVQEPSGLVICPNCEQEVPDALRCVYCGKDMTPMVTARQFEILSAMYQIGFGKNITIEGVHSLIDRSKESVRTMMSNLYSEGLVTRPVRGGYRISEKGLLVLRKSKIPLPEKKVEKIEEKPIIFTPAEVIRHTVARRILKRAASEMNKDIRIEEDADAYLASILEKIGLGISGEAKEIMTIAKKKTIKPAFMKRAIDRCGEKIQERRRKG